MVILVQARPCVQPTGLTSITSWEVGGTRCSCCCCGACCTHSKLRQPQYMAHNYQQDSCSIHGPVPCETTRNWPVSTLAAPVLLQCRNRAGNCAVSQMSSCANKNIHVFAMFLPVAAACLGWSECVHTWAGWVIPWNDEPQAQANMRCYMTVLCLGIHQVYVMLCNRLSERTAVSGD